MGLSAELRVWRQHGVIFAPNFILIPVVIFFNRHRRENEKNWVALGKWYFRNAAAVRLVSATYTHYNLLQNHSCG